MPAGRAPLDLSDLPVVDGHVHPLLADPWAVSPERFLDVFTEGRPGTMAEHVPHTGACGPTRTATDLLAFMEQVALRYATGPVHVSWDCLNIHFDGREQRRSVPPICS